MLQDVTRVLWPTVSRVSINSIFDQFCTRVFHPCGSFGQFILPSTVCGWGKKVWLMVLNSVTYNLGRGNFLIKLRLLELQVVLGPLSRVSKDWLVVYARPSGTVWNYHCVNAGWLLPRSLNAHALNIGRALLDWISDKPLILLKFTI